ncbi:MPT63 family protein [Mycolicibacterium sp. XJ1819]
MKITTVTGVIASTAAAALICAPIVSADAATQEPAVVSQPLGSQAELVDGAVIQGWTISDLKQSSDVISYPVTGTLWEATATDQAIQGAATPIVSNFNARAEDGTNYRALFGAATEQGVNPSTLAEGQETTGKIYFDVTGAAPTSVVYNAGGQDLLVWTQPAPSARSAAPSSTGSYVSEAPEAAPAATPAEETPAAPAAVSTELPEGSQGTPLPEGSQGTPIAEGATEGTPAATAEGTPAPAGDESQTPSTYLPTP